jgi:uncharacterized protein (TIGR00369 family)
MNNDIREKNTDIPENTDVPDGFREIRLAPNPFLERNGPLYGKLEGPRFLVGLRVLERHCNPAGTCHGGMLLTFADMTLIMASNVQAKLDRYLTTVNLSTDFVRAAPLGAWLEGRTDVLRVTGSLVFSQAILSIDGEPVARVSGILKPVGEHSARFGVGRYFGDAD